MRTPRTFCIPALLAFLAVAASAATPDHWTALKITDQKRLTTYDGVTDGGRPAIHAVAKGSASLLARRVYFQLGERPILSWRWKVSRLVEAADNSVSSREDSPARILLAFEGDASKLAPRDKVAINLSKRLSGRALPYATLQYVYSKTAPVGTVIENPHTRRVQMIVASSGAAGVGQWQKLERDVVADFKRAFGEEPGKLIGYGIMSDTDNTGESVEAWYADIAFRARP